MVAEVAALKILVAALRMELATVVDAVPTSANVVEPTVPVAELNGK